MFENVEVNGRVLVPKCPSWVHRGLSNKDAARYYNALTRFYIVETPVKRLSALSVPLDSYGWKRPWAKPEYLNRQLKDAMSQSQALYSAKTRDTMEDALLKADILDYVDENNLQERIVIYNCEKNQFMSTFYHVRNALCHGRFSFIKVKRTIWVALEDVSTARKSDGENVVVLGARMILKYSTLLAWKKLVSHGPTDVQRKPGR